MPSAANVVLSGFSGSGSKIDDFESKMGGWIVENGVVTGDTTPRALLVHKSVLMDWPFTISVTVKSKDGSPTWNGVAVNVRPNQNGYKFLALRVRQGRGALAEWQLLAGDTVIEDTDKSRVAYGFLTTNADPLKAWRITLCRDIVGNLQYLVQQDNAVIGYGTIPVKTLIEKDQSEWSKGSLIGVYSRQANFGTLSNFRAMLTNTLVLDTFRREGTGTLASQQLAGCWQECLGDWVVKEGSAHASVLDGTSTAMLLHTQRIDHLATPLLTADVTLNNAASWSGLVFGANWASDGVKPADYFAFELKDGAWRVVSRQFPTTDPVVTRTLSGKDGLAQIVAGSTYRLYVQFDSAILVRVSVMQGGKIVLSDQAVNLGAEANGARFGISTTNTENSFALAAASVSTPPAIRRDALGNWNADWAPNATFDNSPYKVPALQELDAADVTNASDSSAGQPQHCLYTVTDKDNNPLRQYVGYYDAKKGEVAVTRRSWSGVEWSEFEARFVLEDEVMPQGPDGHYRIAIAEDANGFVHLAANMWASALRYYRTTEPGKLSSLTHQSPMVSDADEKSTTYPAFKAVNGELLFFYRTGGSGDGSWIINKYDKSTSRWSKSCTPLQNTSKSGQTYSAYPATEFPLVGPDQKYHLAWIWRSTNEGHTSLRICYACSDDLRTWRSASGNTSVGTISYDHEDFIVDDVRECGGALNSLVSLGFDHFNKPVIGYVKFDDPALGDGSTGDPYLNGPGSSQFFVARLQGEGGNSSWQRTQLTNYVGRWAPSGTSGVEIPFLIAGATAQQTDSGGKVLALPYIYGNHGGTFVLDAKTLEVIGEQPWRSYSSVLASKGIPVKGITRDSSNATFGATRDEEYVLYQYVVTNGANTALKVLRVK